jgi:hypothetical protein
MQRSITIVSIFALTFATTLASAQPAPTKPHPRIWLDAQTRAGIEAQSTVADSGVARGAARCRAAREIPSSYSTGGWQGFEFVTTLSGCLISWISSQNTDDLGTAIKYWNVLLDDYQSVGDGAGGDSVVTHDTGYAMRTFAPYSALAYDWLHDAPGVSEELRARSRSRFDAWMNYYTTSGYLRRMPGANYQAGYLFAATLIAIAEAGEAGAAGDAHWATVRDDIWGTDMAAALEPGGVLDGGDWPEGWQYAPLSVLEYSLAARALSENGLSVAGAERWASSLVPRFAHALTPGTRQMYPAGDSETESANRDPANGALLAAIAGPADDRARAWARSLEADLGLENENPLFDALAAARDGAGEPFANGATSYLAPGVGNLYARGSWTSDAAWSVFQCSRRLVDDHQHNNAGNFVLSRGADDLVVDPSPYGSLSTLTGNAPAVDSAAIPSGYSPSQGNWGETTALAWAKTASTGVAAARCDYADQFRRDGVPSDVSRAVRDFAFVPGHGSATVVLVDRVVTGSSARGLHLRVRTPTTLALAGSTATGSVGQSLLAVEKVWSTSGAPTVRDMPKASECSSSNRTCDVSRLTGMEYRIDVPGPAGLAIHVVDATENGQPVSSRSMFSGTGYRGVIVEREESAVAVVTNDAPDAGLGGSLVYRVPARAGALHVVLDAPVNADGKSDVLARRDGADCEVTVTAHTDSTQGYDGSPLFVRMTADCAATEDMGQPSEPGGSGGSGGSGSAGSSSGTSGAGSAGNAGASSGEAGAGSSAGASGGSESSGGASGTAGTPGASVPGASLQGGCTFARRRSDASSFFVAAGLLGLFFTLRRRRTAR